MVSVRRVLISSIIISAFFPLSARALTIFAPKKEIRISGTILCTDRSAFAGHGHDAELSSEDGRERIDISSSRGFVEEQCAKDRLELLEVEGELSARFLFWGGNLTVRSVKLLRTLEAANIHAERAPSAKLAFQLQTE